MNMIPRPAGPATLSALEESLIHAGAILERPVTPATLQSVYGQLDGSFTGLCLESGGNSPATFSEHVDLGLIRPRGQG
jgi:hypothetical protein